MRAPVSDGFSCFNISRHLNNNNNNYYLLSFLIKFTVILNVAKQQPTIDNSESLFNY